MLLVIITISIHKTLLFDILMMEFVFGGKRSAGRDRGAKES